PAANMEQVPPQIKKERAEQLNRSAKQTADRFMAMQIGKVTQVLLERYRGNGVYEGHTSTYLPVRVTSERNLVGEIYDVRITKIQGEECFGEIVEG
ncbi:MAG: tRNA (N(6)-L-threonylcarbamoyladenosine(37)-C(2))-methylthiotransferase MtaB, partial [Clostridia bacterium]|nr:tRNA (N(6)-L-threonylcarbamoyladenosine(37)-C(2))-methylthiotransferase MtaB [Clostridia bacterium]